MRELPPTLLPFKKNAKALLDGGAVGHVEYSGGTYQVQVVDPRSKREVWAFLQLDDNGVLKDCFCSCEGAEDVFACEHIAAAYLRLFGVHDSPLHVRFSESLWNRLCAYFSKTYGDDPGILKEAGEGVYICKSGKETVFRAKGKGAKGKKILTGIFFERPAATEETSLKFSKLPEEELLLWRQGRPSPVLRYELSFWNDLAKWLFLEQDLGKKYAIAFSYNSSRLPEGMVVHFPYVDLDFAVGGECLQAIVPALASVESPLKLLFPVEDRIDAITYSPERGEMTLQLREQKEQMRLLEQKGIVIGNWVYLPEKGFSSREKHPLLEKEVYGEKDIGALFENYLPLMRRKLKGYSVYDQPATVHYTLAFDSGWNLSIAAYVFQPGDLSAGKARFFGEWAYLDGKGFVPLKGVVFNVARFIVPEQDVAGFVRQHRLWLSKQPGYRIHITGIETKLTYRMTDDNRLLFDRLAVFEEEARQAKDFGAWIYLKGQGFFSKVNAHAGMHIRSGIEIRKDQIPFFIRMYRDELQLISGFFSTQCPVAKAGLEIELTPSETVLINPVYELRPEYQKREVRFFDDYTYVEGEGFCRLPSQMMLPERYRHALFLEKENLPNFITYQFHQLLPYALKVDKRLKPPEELLCVADSIVLERDRYRLILRYASGKVVIPFTTLWEGLEKRQRYLFTDAGLIDLEADRFQWLRRTAPASFDATTGALTLSALELLRLTVFEDLQVLSGEELFSELKEFRIPHEPDITLLKSHLRPYQELGVKWLWFLYCHRLSGLLCDEMGLGKTHQAMALIAALLTSKKKTMHFLIVCPTSVIYHWEEKLREFLPKARVCTFHGSNRSLKDFHKTYDILLTSYGIWRNEADMLSEMPFEVAVFDEIQAAKNQASRIHKTLLKANAAIRIGLTGTPIENRLRELKAVFDIILPGYMPSETEYKEEYIIPIERQGDALRRELLSKYIKPFILRRKKEEVLLELPEKTEEISHCELSSDQRLLYNDVLHRMRAGILRELEEAAGPIPYLHVFSVLSSLKQICNHPAAFLKIPDSYREYRSGKWDLYEELLYEALESGQKVVVFSQYLAMLDILEKHLNENEIAFATIRGATIARGEEVRRFNSDPECKVFLGSLQAAGLGIDLTAASVVIHYDRWWNAAREDQATDRVHRIGQTRGVQVFKLVTKGSFEERIDAMIIRKGKLMEEVIGVDDHRFMKAFDRDEIIQLLKDVQASS